ncbi:hypothetical protein LPW11_06165 [Geomonas sp. RF6]|uniref:hypothetical protein n=1 Tax=Geomonas sp. RF6 TaxID=2897342 RepID=UPI001E590779|nr:hypothetical protein [Geomonas sp. RF6]UFS71774.1 hypothetical protein LPW11_06165 [Geomonas sp. RF6]
MDEVFKNIIKLMDVEGLDVIVTPRRPLTPEDCVYWAYEPYWTHEQCVWLAMSVHPDKKMPLDVDDWPLERLVALSDKYKRINGIIEKQRDLGTLQYLTVEKVVDETSMDVINSIVHEPAVFVKWAIENLPSFPPDLYHAVRDRKPPCFEGFTPSIGSKRNEKGMPKGTGAEPKQLTDYLWGPKREMEVKASRYVVEALERGCTCSHGKLADFMNTEACDEAGKLLFNLKGKEDHEMRNLLLKVTRTVFKERAPSRVKGDPGYSKPKGPCPIHNS